VQPDDPLLALQRRFASALREPLTGTSRARTELPPRVRAVSQDFISAAQDLITPSATLDPVGRLELYHRQYWYRLLDSLAEDFPALRLLLGDAAFWSLLEAYLAEEAPQSFTLRHLGASLGDFIARHPDRFPLPVHAEELARLEYALMAAFEAAELPAVSPEELTSASLRLQPHLQLFAFRTPADALWRRAAEGRPAPGRVRLAPPRPVRFVAVYRDDLKLEVERIPRDAHAILTGIANTACLEAALAEAASALPARRATEMVSRWFATWTTRRWLARRTD
jgi:hypothetical protein